MAVQKIGPLWLHAMNLESATKLILDLAKSKTTGNSCHLINAYSVGLAETNPSYREVLSGKATNFPDGRPLQWISKLRKDKPSLEQVRGPDLFLKVLDSGREMGTRHFFLGGSEELLELLTAELLSKFPSIIIAGTFSPPFRELSSSETEQQDRLIEETRPDIIWVGLGTPKQDFEARRLSKALNITTVAVGAAFDFTAGMKREAPKFVSFLGFEWLFRLICEPARLWKRYTIGSIFFIWAIRPKRLIAR